MNKRQLIDDIRRFNINVQPRFLAQFDEAALKQYLQNLQAAQINTCASPTGCAGRSSGWLGRIVGIVRC